MSGFYPLDARTAAYLTKQTADRKWAEHARDDAMDAELDQGHLGRMVMHGGVVVEADLSDKPGHVADPASRASFAISDAAALRLDLQMNRPLWSTP